MRTDEPWTADDRKSLGGCLAAQFVILLNGIVSGYIAWHLTSSWRGLVWLLLFLGAWALIGTLIMAIIVFPIGYLVGSVIDRRNARRPPR